ncbi:MAG: aldo/keto reductase [Acidobacteriales bacterium]|nr:aldo/keto reductase [Terriglobales bacterium]
MPAIPFPIPDFLYGTAWKEERTESLIELALRAGFRGIDTANQRRHYYEAAVGRGLASAYQDGIVTRSDVFLQTKFTYRAGQDHRLPYDPSESFGKQVEQSLSSSLEHLRTDYVDSFVLHGPASGRGWTESDVEVWEAMVREQEKGRTRFLGVSNISQAQLRHMFAVHSVLPTFVQNRCFARLGWDREVRICCAAHNMIYQGFSLLTANVEVVHHPLVAAIAERAHATPAQVIFSFARRIGMLPLTGTSNPEHMRQDLQALQLTLTEEQSASIEYLTSAH